MLRQSLQRSRLHNPSELSGNKYLEIYMKTNGLVGNGARFSRMSIISKSIMNNQVRSSTWMMTGKRSEQGGILRSTINRLFASSKISSKQQVFFQRLDEWAHKYPMLKNLKDQFQEWTRKIKTRSTIYSGSNFGGESGGGLRLTGIQKLIALNVAVFLLSNLFMTQSQQYAYLAASVQNVTEGRIYTLLSCCFSHSDLLHIFVNMFMLNQVGRMMPMTRRLLWPGYIFCGLVASLTVVAEQWAKYAVSGREVDKMWGVRGASGSVFGLLAFVSLVHPYIPVGIFFLPFQFKLRNVFNVIIAIECYRWYTNSSSNISATGHLGGALGGLLFFLINRKRLIF